MVPFFRIVRTYVSIGQDEIESLQQSIRAYANELLPDKLQVRLYIDNSFLLITSCPARSLYALCMLPWRPTYRTECSPRRRPTAANVF
jgi:hypothetical protein